MSESHNHEPKGSERYELEELFAGEAPENLHFLKVTGEVVVVALLILAFIYVFSQL